MSDPTSKLDPRKLFFLACKEVFQDGAVSPSENVILKKLQQTLKIAPQNAQAVVRAAKDDIKKKGRTKEALVPFPNP
jgi:uncharacterized tellurite resistance protein B-like protein